MRERIGARSRLDRPICCFLKPAQTNKSDGTSAKYRDKERVKGAETLRMIRGSDRGVRITRLGVYERYHVMAVREARAELNSAIEFAKGLLVMPS